MCVSLRPEQSLEVLRELSPSSITWIQSNEDSYCWFQLNLLSQEVEPTNTQFKGW